MNPQFYILPKALFESPYKKLSPNAKLLYSLLLDRFSLSEKTKFTDDDGALTVIFTNDEVCEKLDCSHTSATKLFIELEKFGLIQRKRQGRGKPILIFVKRIIHSKNFAVKTAKNQTSGLQEFSGQDCKNVAPINTDQNKTDQSETDPSIIYDEIEDGIKRQIEYDILSERDYGGVLDEIVNLLTDTLCAEEEFVWVGKRKILNQVIRKRLSMLTAEHIEYVIRSLEKHEGRIRNMRAYLLTTLYNSVDTLVTGEMYD